MTSAAIYARVSSARQKKDETIGSQTAALREHAAQARLDVPAEWVFEDEGHSGATLVRPALEALRDLAAQGCLDVVLVYSPDRLVVLVGMRKLIVVDSPDALLICPRERAQEVREITHELQRRGWARYL